MTSPAVDTRITQKLDDRYGRTSKGRRLVGWIVAAIVAAALLGWVAWGTLSQAMNSVDVDTTGFHVHDDHSVTVDFQVVSQPGTSFTCAIEAQDVEHGVVGWRVVEYSADPAHTRRFSETLQTTAPATTGLVTSCWIP